jgi:hypothetical protein
MKKIVIVCIGLIVTSTTWAQEFKVAKSSGRLELHLGRVTVEGHSGSEIIFSRRDYPKDKDKRAEGLRVINGLGLEDNTGLGINVTTKGDIISVYQLERTNSPDVKVLVPKGVIVSFSYESQYGSDVKFANMSNEIEVSAQYNSVELNNVTGPLTVKTVYGHVDAVFDNTIKGPISIISIYGHVDVTLPLTTKANLRLDTSYGEIYAAPEFKIEFDTPADRVRSGNRVVGKINGGGINMNFACNYGKVYLRKK